MDLELSVLKGIITSCISPLEYRLCTDTISALISVYKVQNSRHILDLYIDSELIVTCIKSSCHSRATLSAFGIDISDKYISQTVNTNVARYTLRCHFADPEFVQQITNFITFASRCSSL